MKKVEQEEFYAHVEKQNLVNEGPIFEDGYIDEEFWHKTKREVGAFIRYTDDGGTIYFIKELS